ncbi:MAG: hypothetical protein FWG50_01440 [Kiritimatiellaeota bacterium]|nr:hypothetical protein [Kiritimatiellota bacterium]
MKRYLALAALALTALALTAQLHAAETVAIYQAFDMMGQSGYMIMNKEEYAKLTAQIKEEEKAFPAALAEAKKKWDEDKTNLAVKGTFPGNRIKPRSVKKFGSDFNDMEQAKKRLAQAQAAAAEKAGDKAASAQRPNASAEDLKREETRARAFVEAVEQVNMVLGQKLGRPVPKFGFTTPEDPNKKF